MRNDNVSITSSLRNILHFNEEDRPRWILDSFISDYLKRPIKFPYSSN